MSLENDEYTKDVCEKECLGFFKLSKTVISPQFATKGSAAFDLRLFLDGSSILAYNEYNEEYFVEPSNDLKLLITPGWRYKLPTGLIFDIPNGHRLDVNIRGGTGLKKGLSLANDTGIVDSDYVDELFILVLNTSKTNVLLDHNERIAQAKLEKSINIDKLDLFEIYFPPDQKTERSGGFNSTGTK